MRLPLLLLFAIVQPVLADCEPPHRIEWPEHNPVWSLCWVSPDESAGIDGSGIELRDVMYNGKLVLRRAGLPVLNVQYDPGGCGAYRDWQHTLMDFEADNAVGPQGSRYAEPSVEPRTVCDHPGIDAGNFQGVAAWKTADRLTLITQLQAGPYRYIHKWVFWLDGRIDARVAFTSRFDPCNFKPHNHHAYWRFEFGIGGDGDAVAEEPQWPSQRGMLTWHPFLTETTRRSDARRGAVWRVRSPSLQRGYQISSLPENGVADAWAVADLWILAFHPNEIDDGGAARGPGGSAVQLARYIDDEPLDGADLVLWTHAVDRHDGRSTRCHFVGPTLRPTGNW